MFIVKALVLFNSLWQPGRLLDGAAVSDWLDRTFSDARFIDDGCSAPVLFAACERLRIPGAASRRIFVCDPLSSPSGAEGDRAAVAIALLRETRQADDNDDDEEAIEGVEENARAGRRAAEAEKELAVAMAQEWSVGGPWIGVQLAPVPKMLASHLQLEGDHLMLLNIAVDSPADGAGLQQYDVILDVNGDAVREPGEFMEAVKKFKKGDKLKIQLVRGGKKQDAELTIGAKPEMDSIKYKYEIEVEGAQTDAQTARGWMMQKTPDGKWQWKRMDQDPNWGQLFIPPQPPVAPLAPLAPLPPGVGGLFGTGPVDEGGAAVIVETKDGKTTEVRKNADGTIRVTRREEKDGHTNSSSRRFKNLDEFQKGDPEACEMFKRSTTNPGAWGGGVGGGRGGRAPRAWALQQPPVNMQALEKQLQRAQQEAERAMQRARAAELDAFRKHERALNRQLLRPGAAAADKPGISWEMHEDGRISVTTRDGDQELVQHFKNAEDLKARRPDLYQKMPNPGGATSDAKSPAAKAPKNADED